jgi:hypothetical protein
MEMTLMHNVPVTRWGNDGTQPCPRPNVHEREWKRADGTWHIEHGCSWCGWTNKKKEVN